MRHRTNADQFDGDSPIKPSRRRAGQARRVRQDRPLLMGCERLEDRTLLSVGVDLLHAPVWQSIGPVRIQGGQVEGMGAQGDSVIGAVTSIAAVPNTSRVYVGTVNGGV